MKSKMIYSALILAVFVVSLNAQSVNITGRITDSSGEVLPGANVYCTNKTNYTISDIDGRFSISCNSKKDTLIISGMQMIVFQ